MMEKEIMARRTRMQELNSQAQDLVDAGHFDPNAVEETRIVMEERFENFSLQQYGTSAARFRDEHSLPMTWLCSDAASSTD